MESEDEILEAERLQIEQIRELESEELEVEVVDSELESEESEVEVVDSDSYSDSDSNSDSDSDSSDGRRYSFGGAGWPHEYIYDPSLAPLHSYLGEVEDTHRRGAFLEGGAVLTLPLFYLEGVVLFPEATLPLRVVQPHFISAVERALTLVDAPYTIGVVHVYGGPHDRRLRFATVGTTAEIRQYRRLEDGSLNLVTRGQQRFRLRHRWIDVEGVLCGEVQIIQEDLPLRAPRDAFGKLPVLSNLHGRSLVLPSNPSHGYGDGDNYSESNSEESFESELSPEEKRLHRSAIGSRYGYDIFDESTSSDDDKSMHDIAVQSRMFHTSDSDCQKLLHFGHDKRSENSSLEIGSCSTPGKYSRKQDRSNTSLNKFHSVPRAFWPYWVYKMYDSYCLAQRAADMWKQIVKAPSMDGLVKKPDLLSFHIASKIPVSESTRQELLEIDGIAYRLRREIDLLKCFNIIRCKTCQTVIARRSDMLVMSSEGPLGAYVNSHGFVHEVMTLSKANGLALIGRAVKEYSWFPGYAWTIANCANCETQMGWLFTATKKMKPQSFWGIRSSQVADDLQ